MSEPTAIDGARPAPIRAKARDQAGSDGAKQTSRTTNHTASDPLKGWFDLAKPSRESQQKSAWKRGRK